MTRNGRSAPRGRPPIIGKKPDTITEEILFRARLAATDVMEDAASILIHGKRERDAIVRTIEEFDIDVDPIVARKVANILAGAIVTLCIAGERGRRD